MRPLLASEFPEDPLFILRAGWPFLVAYYIVAALIVFFLENAQGITVRILDQTSNHYSGCPCCDFHS